MRTARTRKKRHVVGLLLLVAAACLAGPLGPAPAQGQPPVPELVSLVDRPFAGPYFVTQQYRDLLGRETDRAGLAFWVERLATDTSAPAMVEEFVSSAEFAGTRAPVARLYLAAFGRLPDDEGWRFWSNKAASGGGLISLAEIFLGTPEGQESFVGLSDDELVRTLYRNVLDREADPAGLTYWLDQLAGGTTPAEVLVAFSESPEFVASSTAKIRAALLYSGLLGRSPDPGGLEYWQARLTEGTSYAQIVDGFLRSAEYRARLSGLWCQFVEVTPFEHLAPLHSDTEWDRMVATARGIFPLVTDTNGEVTAEEFIGLRLDRLPDPRVVVALGGDVEQGCLTLLSGTVHPELVRFVAKPYLLSELWTADREVNRFLQTNNIPYYGAYRSFGLNIELAGAAEPRANEVINRWGPFIEELRVGVFPYPMPNPPWPAFCHPWRDGAVQPSAAGLSVTAELSATSAVAGSSGLSYTLQATNTGTQRLLIEVSSDNQEFVLGPPNSGAALPSVSRILGNFALPGQDYVLAPGHSATIAGPVGTEACDPAAGHRLPSGPYTVRGYLDVWVGDNPDVFEDDPDFVVQVPPVAVDITR